VLSLRRGYAGNSTLMLDADFASARRELIDQLSSRGVLRSQRVRAAFDAIPRHRFVPAASLADAYRDKGVRVYRADGSVATTASQPTAVADALELVAPEPGENVLEIGAGTGYNAALLSHLVGPTGHVTTIDIDPDVASQASANLASLGIGPDRIHVVSGDGALGFVSNAPYDCILFTVGTDDFSLAWWEQLRRGGRLVLPLAIRGLFQLQIAFIHHADRFESRHVGTTDYMWLQGLHAVDFGVVLPLPGTSCRVQCHTHRRELAQAVPDLLTHPGTQIATGVKVRRGEFWSRLARWLSLRVTEFFSLMAGGPDCARGMLPRYSLDEWDGFAFGTLGVLGGEGLALLEPEPPLHPPAPRPAESETFELCVRGFGPSATAAERLHRLVIQWADGGRESTEGARIRAFPVQHPVLAEDAIRKSGAMLLVDWPA
jgi:protein-L-isoaspartate(D-aspartate) O-methyltransferase